MNPRGQPSVRRERLETPVPVTCDAALVESDPEIPLAVFPECTCRVRRDVVIGTEALKLPRSTVPPGDLLV